MCKSNLIYDEINNPSLSLSPESGQFLRRLLCTGDREVMRELWWPSCSDDDISNVSGALREELR